MIAPKLSPPQRIIFLILCSFGISFLTRAEDTLRFYDPASNKVALQTTMTDYVARFDLPGPGYLKKLVVWLGGTSDNGKATVKIYGHEGGTSFPQFEADLVSPFTIQKTKVGDEPITVTLPKPIWFNNNQFFVVLTDVDPDVRVLAESKAPMAECSSSSGGDYYHIFLKNAGNQWYLGNRNAMCIDAIMKYEVLPQEPWFQDVTSEVGIASNLSNRNIAWGDLNGDNFSDLVVDGKVYFNTTAGKFADKTAEVGISPVGLSTHALMDINNDGLLDILLLYNDSSMHKVLINKGEGKFNEVDITAEIPVSGISSFSIADINEDGYPDIFIGRLWTSYPSTGPDIVSNTLFMNDGNNDFEDASTLLYPPGYVHRRSRGSAWCDFDNDGDQDLFVANYYLEPDELWVNNGDQTFTDLAQVKGIDKNSNGGSNHGTGCAWGDYDNDGNFDLLVPQLAHPAFTLQYGHQPTTLYRNSGDGNGFVNHNADLGIQTEETHAGAAWADINADGLLDFVITTFYGCRYIDIYLQNEDHTFSLKTWHFGLARNVTGQDACWADFDGDGRLDLAMGEDNKFRLYKNEIGESQNNYLSLELRSTSANKLALGARVEVTAGGKTQIQEVTAGSGVRMQGPGRLFFGLGTAHQIDKLRVRWPGKTSWEEFSGIKVNGLYYITEGGSVDLGQQGMPAREDIVLYPNPSGQEINVQLSGEKYCSAISIISATGAEVYRKNYDLFLSGINLQIGTLSPGIYILKIYTDRSVYVKTICKK